MLIVDADPQANLSDAFGWSEDLRGERFEDLLTHPEAAARHEPPVALLPDVGGKLIGVVGCESSRESDGFARPQRDGLKWPHLVAG